MESYRGPPAGDFPEQCGPRGSQWTPKDGQGANMGQRNPQVRDLKITEKGGFSGPAYPIARHSLVGEGICPVD